MVYFLLWRTALSFEHSPLLNFTLNRMSWCKNWWNCGRMFDGCLSYEGAWERDERHGEGVLAHEASGFLYVGQWVHNKKCGEGHLYSQKERYWGQFLDNKYHGKVSVEIRTALVHPLSSEAADQKCLLQMSNTKTCNQ